MLKLIALTSVLVAGLSSTAFAGGPTGDAKVQNSPTTVKGYSSQPVHHYNGGLPKCRSITLDNGEIVEVCAAQ